MRKRLASSVLCCAVALCAAGALAAQQRPQSKLSLEQYLDWRDVQNPQLSPDGSQVIYTRRWIDKMNDRWETSLFIMNADGSHQRALVQGSDVKWSPDGKRIAYIAKGEPTGQQIFVRWMDAEGAVTQVSHLTETPSAVEWAPDGKSLAFLMTVPSSDTFPHPDARGAEGRQVDGAAEGRHAAQLPLRPRRLHGRRLQAHLPDLGRRRRAAPDHERRLEPLGARVLGRRQVDRLFVAPRGRRRSTSFRQSQIYARERRDGRDPAAHAPSAARTTARSYSPDGKIDRLHVRPTRPITRRGRRGSSG